MREKKRLLEETRLTVEALEEEQNLERLREREEAEFRRKELEIEEERLQKNAEWSRKREMLRVELEMKKAAAGLIIEQEELESDLGDDKSEASESKPRTLQPKADLKDSHQYSPQGGSNSGGTKLQPRSPSANQQGLPPQATPANQPLDSQQSYQPNQSPLEQTLLYTIQELIRRQPISSPQHQVPPHVYTTQWTALADTIRQGPSLPKIELIKFGGDPSEYAEFTANFRDHIESQVKDDSQRLTRLLAQCVGKAKEAIRSCVNLPVGQRYREARETLSNNFGQPHMVAEAHMKRLREINLRRGDAPSLMDFARKLEDAKRVLTSMGPHYASRLDNEVTILMLMKKLPDEGLKRKWTDIAGDLIQSKGQVDFVEFLNFIQKRADRLNNRFGQELKSPLAQNERERRYPNRERQEQPPFRATTMATQRSANGNAGSVPWKCPQCSGAHAIWRCEIFKSASYQDRLRIMRQKRLCGSCLGGGHFSRSCRKGFTCKEPGCGRRHNTFLHPPDSETTTPSEVPQRETEAREPAVESRASSTSGRATAPDRTTTTLISSSSTSATSRETGLVGAVQTSRLRVCFKVVPVRVSAAGGSKQVETYAFLDSGSDTTLCLRELVDELGVDCEPCNFTIATVNHEGREIGHQVRLDIEALDGETKFTVDNVLTTKSLPIAARHFASNQELKRWPHLSGISIPEIDEKKVTILIGSDRPDITDNDSEKRRGPEGQPYAVKTPLGWTVYGPMGENSDDGVHVNFIRSEHEETLSRQLENLYNAEFGDSLSSSEQKLSVEDQRAKKIMEESAKLVNGHYQFKLPFRYNPLRLPDSLPTAKKRLYWLRKKMEKDPKFHEQYASVVEKYQAEGSSRLVPDEEISTLKPVWHLPHHAVWHPRKPDEPRVVFDCACRTEGVSLNDQLLQGPENTSTLIGVILRFRVNSVAVAADIKRMFHQVFVSPEDRGALCYLWWPGGDLTKEPKTYQMLVHIFGATSSPSVCGYALRKAANDNREDFSSETVEAALRDFYVDDLLKSFETTGQAVEVTKQLQELLASGGFQLTKIMSSDRDVLAAFPPEERAPAVKNLDLKLDRLPADRALGIHWNVEKDTFNLVVSDKVQPETRRGVLSSIATIYDPLGYVSPLLLPGREINQELCRKKCGWNDELPEELAAKWREWKTGLASLKNYSISRPFTPRDFGKVETVELHHFADASEGHGYGTASYLRFINERGRIHNSFVMGKSRVRPLRSGISVPKLELTAATLLIKMNELITRELEGRIAINSVTFWTDSAIVLRYIYNESRRFVTFVANRAAVIREASSPSQWRHVRSEVNPADYASRGIKATETEKLKLWKHGPNFLWRDSDEWSQQPPDLNLDLADHDEGVKRERVTVNTAVVEETFWNPLFERYSTWEKLRRVVAWLIRGSRALIQLRTRRRVPNQAPVEPEKTPRLSVSDLEEAERRIVRNVQTQAFPEEFCDPESRKSPLVKLKPFVKEGLLRVGGRLNRSDLDYDAKHPMVLPGKHRITEMIILSYHFTHGHVGAYQVLAETRQRFWIVNGVSSVRRVLKGCHDCRRQNARVGEQITAPLPVVRVSSDSHQLIYPFAAVGIDYFGPLYVHTGPVTRSKKKNPTLHKRYGCIFACLRYRAVHIEIANDLSTDSFNNAVTRFVARRGPPRMIYSDNGTNFRGSETDVMKALKTWDQEKIGSELQRKNIQWYFNPPAASHQGGVWERLIRSVRRILHSMVGEHLVNDGTLTTFLVEVEKILNSRPLTRVSSDPNDLDALTPNHILLLRHNPCSAPDEFQDSDKFQARWKHDHLLANEFWKRSVKEYLPMLQERQKWLTRKPNFKAGDLVIMKDGNVPRGQWPRALVQETFPDRDGVVRQVLVRTANGTYRRDVRKLCMLEEELLKSIEGKMLT